VVDRLCEPAHALVLNGGRVAHGVRAGVNAPPPGFPGFVSFIRPLAAYRAKALAAAMDTGR